MRGVLELAEQAGHDVGDLLADVDRVVADPLERPGEIGTDPDVREWAMTMMLVARALERIGDNAVDVGEQVAFVVSGLFREFSDASHRLNSAT